MAKASAKTLWARTVARDSELPYAARLLAAVAIARYGNDDTGELHLSRGQAALAIHCDRSRAGRLIAALVARGWLVLVAKGTRTSAARYRADKPAGVVLLRDKDL